MSAFFWTYTALQIPVGWLAERYGAHRVLATGLAIWALATMLVGVVSGFLLLLVLSNTPNQRRKKKKKKKKKGARRIDDGGQQPQARARGQDL